MSHPSRLSVILLIIVCTLVSQNNALPVYSELTFSDGVDVRAVDAHALAQPIVQRPQDEAPSMDLPVLSGNATEAEDGAIFPPSADSELQFEGIDQVAKPNIITMKADPWPSNTQAVFNAAKAAIGLKPRSSAANPFSKRYQVTTRKLITEKDVDGTTPPSEEEVIPRQEKPLLAQNPPVIRPAPTSTQRQQQVQQPQQRTSRTATRPTPVGNSGNKSPPIPFSVRSQLHSTVRAKATTTTAHSSLRASVTSTSTSTPTPTPAYHPGWCGIHVRQVFWNTCLGRNHADCIRINHTISIYDGAQTRLASANTTLTWDGKNTFSLNSSLPFPVTFKQLDVADGINFPHKGYNMYNMWPVIMGYEGADGGMGKRSWRNDDETVCKFGMWENVNQNRDFDCGFSCPAPAKSRQQQQQRPTASVASGGKATIG